MRFSQKKSDAFKSYENIHLKSGPKSLRLPRRKLQLQNLE